MADGYVDTDESKPIGRRVFLSTLGVGGLGLATAPFLQRGWDRFLGAASRYDPTQVTGLLPNLSGFRHYSVAGSVPHKDETNYQLTVDGLVDRPMRYTLKDLTALPQGRVVHDVQCTEYWEVNGYADVVLCGDGGLPLFPPLSELVGCRHLVVTIQEWAGILLSAPCLLGLASPMFRRDLRRLNRFFEYDWKWLRSIGKRRMPRLRPAAKFNAGQKVFAGWIAGAVLIMMFTGLLMWFTKLLPVISRTSVIFLHDWGAVAISLVLAGHMRMAYKDPEAWRGMRTGFVHVAWAKWQRPKWTDE